MYSLCLNPCLDRAVEVRSLAVGSMNRVLACQREVSGKGVNVAIMARRLGLDSRLAGFTRQEGGDQLAKRLDTEGIDHHLVEAPGALRENIKILDQSRQLVTEVNEPGAPVTQEALDSLFALIEGLARRGDIWVLTGSMPPGCPPDLYRRLIDMLTPKGVRCVLDAEGDALDHGLKARPALIKPNQYEVELAVGHALPSPAAVRDAALSLCEAGAERVVVSMGREGALITDGAKAYYAAAVDVPVLSSVGAGDCMVAGLLFAWDKQLPLDECLAWGVAAASAAVALPGTDLPTAQQVASWVGHVDMIAMI